MSTLREFTLDQGVSEVFEVDTSKGAVLEVIVDPGGSRGAGSANPPVGSYDLDIRDRDGNSVGISPVSSGFDDEITWVTSDIGGLMEVEITNTGSGRGTVSLEISVLTGKEAIKAIQTGTSIDFSNERSLRLAEFSFLDGKVLVDDGRVYDDPQVAEQAASSWALFGPGLFETESFTVTDDGFTLAGFGKLTHLRRSSDESGSMVVIDGADRVTVRDMRVSTPSGAGLSDPAIVGINSPLDGIVENCFVSESDFHGISIQGAGASDWIVENNLVAGTIENTPIRMVGRRALVKGNTIRGVAGVTGVGIRLNGVGSRAIANDVEDTSFSIDISGAGSLASQNRFENAENAAVSLQAQNPEVKDNKIIQPGDTGVSAFSPSANDSVISDNFIRDTVSHGIFIDQPDCQVTDNKIIAPGGEGIRVSGADATVSDNRIEGATEDAIDVGTNDSSVTDNYIRNPGDDGIDIVGNRPTVEANIIRSPGDLAIVVAGNAAIIVANMMRGIGGTTGILSGGDRHTIGRNEILGPDIAVDVDGANTLVSDNMFNNTATDVDTADATTPTVTDNVAT